MATPPKTRRKAAQPPVVADAASTIDVTAVKPASKTRSKAAEPTPRKARPAAKKAASAKATKPEPGEAPVIEAVEVAKAPAKKAAAKTVARKSAASRAKPEAVPAAEPSAQEAPAIKPRKPAARSRSAKPAAAAAAPSPYSWTHVEGGADDLFGVYELIDKASGVHHQLTLRGSATGHYRCSCAAFAASDQARCEHSDFLLAQLQAQGPEQSARLAQGRQGAHSEVWLGYGLERRLHWRAGQTASPELISASQALLASDGSFSAEQGHVLTQLLQLAAQASHELRVDDEVWQQLAWAGDAQQRVLRLESAYGEGPASAALQALLCEPLPAYQWEAALFAVCAGRALLADDLGLSQRAPALAALRLWQQVFGMGEVLILAPAQRHSLWQAEAQRLLGAWPEGVSLLDVDALAADVPRSCDLLIVDAVQELGTPLPAMPQSPHLLLLADRELLGEPTLPALIAWLDLARRGPLARLLALGEKSSKRQQREVLDAVMLSRRRRDLQPMLPPTIDSTLWLDAPAGAAGLDPAALQQVRSLLQRWQRLAYLSHAEQLQLMQALARLRQAAISPPACEAKVVAVIELLPRIMPAAASRLVIAAQQDATLLPLAQRLQLLGLSVQQLRRDQPPAEREAALAAWRDDRGQILLATDGSSAELDPGEAGVALIHFDLPWNPAQRVRRAEALISSMRGLPSWQLLLRGSFDAAVLAAQQGQESLPAATLDGETAAQPFLDLPTLAVLMAALERGLARLLAE